MIHDRLERAHRYAALHPLFETAFAWLRQPGLAELAAGRHAIDGDRLFAMVAHAQMRPADVAQLEAHRQYIDIQYILEGTDTMGWSPLERCPNVVRPYESEADILFFSDTPQSWVTVQPAEFVVYWPQDAHAPLVGEGQVHKIVLKVAVDS